MNLVLRSKRDAAKELLRRRESRRRGETLRGFVQEHWTVIEPTQQLVWGWAMDAICDHLQATIDGGINRLLINVPPGMSKSITTSVFFPAFIWTKKPSHKILGTAHKLDLAIRDSRKCRNLILSPEYQMLYGDKFSLLADQNQKIKFENDHYGFREAMAFTSLTGSRGDTVILDDPLSVDDARSEVVLKQVEETFTEALPTRLNDPTNSVIIVIMQRLHELDPSGIILERELGYEHLMLPMEFEPERKCYTSIGFEDPRTEDGELLLPERFTPASVAREKKIMGAYATAGQFQQRPAPRGGGLFQTDKFQFVTQAPEGCLWVRGWDLAATEDANAAYTAGALLGRSLDGKFYLKDVRRIQKTPKFVEELLKSTAQQDGYTVKGSIPQDPGQAGKSQVANLIALLAGYDYHASPESGSKEQRAAAVAAQVEAGNFYIVHGAWNQEFIDEAKLFPVGKFKDQIDALSRAFMTLIEAGTFSWEGAV